jgi:hypothetical protein
MTGRLNHETLMAAAKERAERDAARMYPPQFAQLRHAKTVELAARYYRDYVTPRRV